jgi:hypothetical protein
MFFFLRNIYQRQRWKYALLNIHERQSQEYYKQTIIT